MKECSVKMESRVSEIQIETKDEKEPGAVSPQKERQESRAATLCFKRRKKTAKVLKPKAGSETAVVTKKRPPEAGASDQPQQPTGAWASIKRLVTRRESSESSKKQKLPDAEVQPEDRALPKKQAKSKLKIPCIRFSRGAKRNHRSKLTEDSDYSLRVQGEAEDLEIKTQAQSTDQPIQAKSTQGLQEGVLVEDGKEVRESRVNNSITSGKNVISVELELENESSAIQMGTPVLEKETEVIKEKQSVQAQQAQPLESLEADCTHPVASGAAPSPAPAHQRGVEEPSDGIRESAPSRKDDRSRKNAAEEKKSREIVLGQAEETTWSQAEVAAVSQAEKSAGGQAEEATVAQREEATEVQAEKVIVAQAEDATVGQAEEATEVQAEEATEVQAEEATVGQAEEATEGQAEEATEVQAEEATEVQAEEATVVQAEEATEVQAEEATVVQAEDATVVQAEEATVVQAEEATEVQVEATEVQAEEATVGQAEEGKLSQAEKAPVSQAEEATVIQVEEATEVQAEEATLSQAPDLKENGIDAEKPRSEDSKRIEPIAIIITDTEISEFDVKKSKNVPKQFLISMENEQVGVFANDSDFEGRTSEQYETLLIETASSLVKNAIQLSVEQLVNEMVSEDSKINTLLQ